MSELILPQNREWKWPRILIPTRWHLGGLVDGGMVNNGHAMVDAGIIRVRTTGVVFLDTFTRSSNLNGSTANSGQTWVVVAGAWQTSGTFAECTTNLALSMAYVEFSNTVQDMTLTWGPGAVPNTPGLAMRAVDINNYWQVYYASATTSIALQKRVAGVETTVGSYNSGQPGAGDTMRVTVDSGNNWTVYINGVSRITATDSALSTATKAGVSTFLNCAVWDKIEGVF